MFYLIYFFNSWAIKAKVINKIGKKSYKTNKGYYFSVDLLDSTCDNQPSVIRAVGFNKTCDMFVDQLELDKVSIID